jgi:CDP-4-dehydro-6-deoxyglucose reductase
MSFKNFSAKVISKKALAKDILLLTVRPTEKIDFLAGQYISFKIAEKINRSYSIASAPNGEELEFIIDITPGGPGSQFADSLELGSHFNAMGPFGFFTLDNTKALENEEPLIFIGTGSGIVPFRSIILDLLKNKNSKREIYLYFGLRFDDDTYLFDEFALLEQEFSNFKFTPVISRPSSGWFGETGHCQDIIKRSSPIPKAKLYVCGRNETVKAISTDLQEFDYPKENIFFEKFG